MIPQPACIHRVFRYKARSTPPFGNFLRWVIGLSDQSGLEIKRVDFDLTGGHGRLTKTVSDFLKDHPALQSYVDATAEVSTSNSPQQPDSRHLHSIASLLDGIPKRFSYRDVKIRVQTIYDARDEGLGFYGVEFQYKNDLKHIGRMIEESAWIELPYAVDHEPSLSPRLIDALAQFPKQGQPTWELPNQNDDQRLPERSREITEAIRSLAEEMPRSDLSALRRDWKYDEPRTPVNFAARMNQIFREMGLRKSKGSFGMGVTRYDLLTDVGNRILIDQIYSHQYGSIQFHLIWQTLYGSGSARLHLIPFSLSIAHPFPLRDQDQVEAVAGLLKEKLPKILDTCGHKIDETFGPTPGWFFT